MSHLDKLYIAATGMITPIGFDTEMTAASVRAGINTYQDSVYFNKNDKPMKTAWVPEEALPELNGELKEVRLNGDAKRIIRLCHAGLNELMPKASLDVPLTLILAGPENIPARTTPVTADIIQHISVQTKVNFDMESSRYAGTGRAGVIEAINYAFKYLSQEGNDYVLVGGVDTYANVGLLSLLDSENRILATNTTNGFAPGEAASFILLSKKYNRSFLPVALSMPGVSKEEGHLYSDEVPYRGDGLALAFEKSLKNSGSTKVKRIYSSMNGENFFVKEFGVASIRNSEQLISEHKVIHPADCYGDLGAATGAVLTTLAALDAAKENVSGSSYLVYCSSDLEKRAAIC
ncbi:MAG: hypothetical protein OQJ89_14375, partial [Kangiellaceae bacterium]|nr:hypothetical protein [Kangiellaceae bacterium]